MNRNSIIYKLFGITLLFFTVLIVFNFLINRLFLEEYYSKQKIKSIIADIENFSKDYLNEDWSFKETIQNVDHFTEKNNAPMLLVDERGRAKYTNKYGDILIIKSKDGDVYTADLDQIVNNKFFHGFVPQMGNEIRVTGTSYLDRNSFKDVLKIIDNREKYYDEDLITNIHKDMNNNKFHHDLNIKEIRGEIIYINNSVDAEKGKQMSYKSNLLMEEIKNVFGANKFSINEIQDNSIIDYEYTDPNTNNKNMIFIKPLISYNGDKQFVFVITSFQPIDEAIDIIGRFNVYVFLFALILIVFLSFIYSRMIASPLLKINQVAESMANLDFSVRCEIDSKDELGNLSKSINTMSTNLSNSLEDLKRANEKLMDDIEREKRQEEKRRQFIADVSHELKTPLGIMRGFAAGIQDDIYEAKKDYYLEIIIDEIEKMDGLVLDMLTISKLQAIGYKLNMEKFFIDDLINRSLKKYINIFDEKELKVSCLCESYEVYGDEDKIGRVIDNLLSNAVKYSKSGAKVNIKTEEQGELIYFYIENTETYIPEAEIDNIWDRFYRVEHSRNRLFGGTGLGLNIVKNILKLHKSDYGVRNTEYGVEFYFSLPKL
ncbi:sensor histidine kinase [Wukongibacter sp. M2B1]|uniref:sensor histidine kinase n=1 Tax=Wukongibacter sp. M2B1 TaxID=3088895 RepID=UPI003D798BF2